MALAPLLPAPAHAKPVRLRDHVCHAVSPEGPPPRAGALSRLSFDCDKKAPTVGQHDWLWLDLGNTDRLRAMPADWQLLIDQARFERIAVATVGRDGTSQTLVRGPGDFGNSWMPGGAVRFTIARPGAEIARVYVGFVRLDDLSLMRKLTALTPADASRDSHTWLLLMGIFSGALISAFCYNLLIYTGQRYAFQRWYLVWAVVSLAYGLTWSGVGAMIVPGFVGPSAVRFEFVLVGLLIGAGNMFFLSVIEEGVLPRWLKRAGTALAAAGVFFGCLASLDWLLPAAMTDRWMNYTVAGSALSVSVGVGFALARRSRVVWFYLIGWMPTICVFSLRLARNLGFLPQDDNVDMATFGALAFESICFSMAIADRFRLLRRERDLAEQVRGAIAIESEALRRAAQTDFLTRLGNRAFFHDELNFARERWPDGFTLILVDLDHLKDSNDRLGHDGGDALLVHVATRLSEIAGPQAKVARIGGDEFAIILPQDVSGTLGPALDGLQGERLTHAGRSWTISLSLGSAHFPIDAQDPDALYKDADLALYRAKQLGRGRWLRYDSGLRAAFDRKSAFVSDAHAALDRGEFTLHYQPIVDLRTRQRVGNEALLRWKHPRHGSLSPAVFGDILSDSEVGLPIQELVLSMVLVELGTQTPDAQYISVNFTASQLRGKYAARRILDRIHAAGVAPSLIVIELTEGIVLERNTSQMTAALTELHEAGVRIALDDFGTGYASLIHLNRLPIDTLKIDRSFVHNMLEDGGQSEEIIRAIIGLGNGLNMRVIAEGIENEAQSRRLQALGCHFGQGYLFGRPRAHISHGGATPGTRLIAG